MVIGHLTPTLGWGPAGVASVAMKRPLRGAAGPAGLVDPDRAGGEGALAPERCELPPQPPAAASAVVASALARAPEAGARLVLSGPIACAFPPAPETIAATTGRGGRPPRTHPRARRPP